VHFRGGVVDGDAPGLLLLLLGGGALATTILGGLAEFERELIKARTAEGRERAMGRGVRMGRNCVRSGGISLQAIDSPR